MDGDANGVGGAKKKGKGKGDGEFKPHCKTCLADGTLPDWTGGINSEETKETIPDWVVRPTARCQKNPLKGWICKTCFGFGHSPKRCTIENLYNGTGTGWKYKQWKAARRRDFWEMPVTEDWKKEWDAQLLVGPYPEPHTCYAAA